MIGRRVFLAGLVLSLAAAGGAEAARINTARVEIRESLPVLRPDFPTPSDPDMLFYIQRSTNSNTVVYTANFRADGTLDPRRPVSVFWRRFNTTGERRALGFMEDRLAYGIRTRPIAEGEYEARLVAHPERIITIRQTGLNAAEAVMRVRDRLVRPVYVYVDVDDSGLIPSVVGLKFVGTELSSGKAVIETSVVTGGQIQ